MKKYDWESNIKTNIFMLRMLGLWPKGDGTYKRDLYMFYVGVLLATFLYGHMFFQAVNIYFIQNDINAVTGTIYVLIVELMVVFKSYYLIKNMAMTKQLLNILKTDMFQPKNQTQISAIEANVWFWKIIYNVFLYLCMGVSLCWALFPFLVKSETGQRQLPFIAWYPYDTTKFPAYQLTYVYQMTSIVFITTIHVNIDALAAALNVFNASQFEILCDTLRNLHKLNQNFAETFKDCVKHHWKILSYAEKSNKFLNWILFVQIFASGIAIGMTMFQLSMTVPLTNEFNTFFSYVIASAAQIFMYCWFGNEIEVKSNDVPYAAFECDWMDFSQSMKKDLLFFTLRAQTPVKLSTLNLFYLSLETFMKIMKTSWSYFALLHQVSLRE